VCGIIGYVLNRGTDPSGLEEATDLLAHRGPDDRGTVDFTLANSGHHVGLGHTRLSIHDLSCAGHQPMSNETGRIWICYNGEVYNFKSLRDELRGKGYTFNSGTDTEVVLRAYEAWGLDCLQRLDGMFAFSILDLDKEQVLVARDRLGIKPLYVSETDHGIAFSSEVKGLFRLPWIECGPNWEVLLSHILFLWAPEPETAFQGIRKLPAGHYMLCKGGKTSVEPYWSLRPTSLEVENRSSAVKGMEETLRSSVLDRTVADVPVGALLSGGLDSSLISAMLAQNATEQLTTYSISYRQDDRAFEAMPDDSHYARVVAEHIGSDHHDIEIEPDIVDLLPAMLWHLEEPIADPAAINTYLICKAARERGTKVLLSGMGADEIFGGYRKHLSVLMARRYKNLVPAMIRKHLVGPVVRSLPAAGGSGGYRWFRWAKRFEQSASLDDVDCFIGNSSYYPWAEMNDLLTPEFRREYHSAYPVRRHLEMFSESSGQDLLTQMTYTDTKLFLAGLNLAYTDKASMAASVEVRVPFLDHRLVETAVGLPSRLRIRGFEQKWLLRQIGYQYLPRKVVDRPKAPFGAPLRSWMRRDLMPMLREYLSEESVKQRGYFQYSSIKRMIDANESGREDYAHRLWGLLTLEVWHRIFVDGEISPSFPQ
jgi:asparagine synthase (glutamine-hydrolysing)